MSFFGDLAGGIVEYGGGAAGGFGQALRGIQDQENVKAQLGLEQERIDSSAEQRYLDRLHQTRESRADREADAAESAQRREEAKWGVKVQGANQGTNVSFGPGDMMMTSPMPLDMLTEPLKADIRLQDAQGAYYKGQGRQTGSTAPQKRYTQQDYGEAQRIVAAAVRQGSNDDPLSAALGTFNSLVQNPAWRGQGFNAVGVQEALYEIAGEHAMGRATRDPMAVLEEGIAAQVGSGMGMDAPAAGYTLPDGSSMTIAPGTTDIGPRPGPDDPMGQRLWDEANASRTQRR